MFEFSAITFTRWFLAGYFVFVAAFYTSRILAARGRTGASPVLMGQRGTRHYVNYLLFRIFRAVILLVCVLRVPLPGLDRWLVPLAPLWQPAIIFAGDALLIASLTGILYVHVFLGEDWRSGVNPAARQLITKGPYARSRNPMALLIQVAQFGLFLALPTVFTLICLVAGVWAIHAQVRLEEKELARLHGAAYRDYTARTGRWWTWRVPPAVKKRERGEAPPAPAKNTRAARSRAPSGRSRRRSAR